MTSAHAATGGFVPDSSPWRFFPATYDTGRLKTLAVWSAVRDDDLRFRCAERARTPLEHIVHQCVSHDTRMRTMLGIDLATAALPAEESGGDGPPLLGPREKPVTERP